jgi:hypothetical protein
LPLGGAALTGVVTVIFVGLARNGCRALRAAAVPELLGAAAASVAETAEDEDELELPHAARLSKPVVVTANTASQRR